MVRKPTLFTGSGNTRPVEVAVKSEIADLAQARPGSAQIALALARVLDDPEAVSSKPAAVKVPAAVLDKLSSSAAQGRRGSLSLVRMTTSSPSA